jgi:hypothetical protein
MWIQMVERKGSFGDAWGASNWLRIASNANNVYGPGMPGLDQTLVNKLSELGRLVGSRIRVHSGCRPGDRGWHGKCRAADFSTDGQSFIQTYQKALATRRMFDRYQFIYHAPGRRACSSGEHNHLGRPDNYPINSFCHEKTCNWSAECNNIRIGFDTIFAFKFDQAKCDVSERSDSECWKSD